MSAPETPPPVDPVLYSPWPDSDLYQTLDGLNVETALSILGEKDRRVIEQKYGLVDGEPKSRKQVAKQENISPGRVGVIVRKSLGKIAMLRDGQLEYPGQPSAETEALE